MRRSKLLLALTALLVGAVPAVAVDYAKIDRTIAKEPAYQSKAPRYFLLVFGPEAKTRVWLVLDGDVLYVDRNGNGDLTEAGERLTRTDRPELGEDSIVFTIGDLTEMDGKTRHTRVRVSITRDAKQEKASLYTLLAYVDGKYRQFATGGTFANRPQEAPIAHLNGPLTLGLHDNDLVPKLARGERDLFLSAWIGTPNPGKDTKRTLVDFTEYAPDVAGVPRGIHPVAELEFPSKKATGKPIKVQVVLAKRH